MKQNDNLPVVVHNHITEIYLTDFCPFEKRGEDGLYWFYLERIYAVPHYGEKAGMELLALICKCAFWDKVLTDEESTSIIKICHSKEWYKIFKEMNYNEGWN